jgi:2,3,4,5-tetrahydropyridine-2-carboxylate N-succinyltransferase
MDRTGEPMDVSELESRIAALVAEPEGIKGKKGRAVDEVIAALDEGKLRVASFDGEAWVTHGWIKQAILLYFARMDNAHVGPECAQKDAPENREFSPTYFDKVPTKRNYKKLGVRCVPGGIARYGSFLGRGAILMPAFVNIGAYVDEGSMVDTWATVGSCAQIGKNVHLAGGVGIGGVLEPPQAAPVIVEDGAFIGSRCIVVEGVRIGAKAVLGAGVVITGSTSIVDVRGDEPVITKGVIPPNAVVIPGTMPKTFPAGSFGVPVALIIGTRNESTDMKTSLNAVLRDYEIAV